MLDWRIHGDQGITFTSHCWAPIPRAATDNIIMVWSFGHHDDINTFHQVELHIVCTSLALLAGVGASCTYKGQEVCEGAVVKEMKKSVRICTEGKVLKKKKEEVEPGYPLAGGECKWYGEVLCDGAVVQVGVNASTILTFNNSTISRICTDGGSS